MSNFSIGFLDRIINTVIPKTEDDSSAPASISPRQQQMDTLFKRLKDSKSEEDKTIIRGMFGKIMVQWLIGELKSCRLFMSAQLT
ncbi:MAG: hypothetical protein R3E08_14120 [Thiotrichaceae bacterium]